MTDQHRATPEQWEHVESCTGMKQIPWATADCLLELRARVEALEVALAVLAESHRFCTDAIVRRVEALEAHDKEDASCWAMVRSGMHALRARIEALEATQHAHADVSRLSDAERERLTQELAKPAAWRPFKIETTYGTEAAITTAQRYQFRSATEKVPTTRLYSYSVGPAKPLDELGQGHTLVSPEPASAEAMPTFKESLTDGESLLERVAKAIYNVPHDSAAEARAAICAVATWLDRFALHGSGEYAQAAKVLRQEVGRG